MKKISFSLVVMGAIFLLATAGFAQQKISLPLKQISIGTAGTAGTYYIIGAGMSKMFEKYLDVRSTAEVTSGAIENIRLLESKKVEIALLTPESADLGVKGLKPFSQKYDLQALIPLYPNVNQFLVLKDSPIKSFADLKGKSVSLGSPGSGILGSNQLLFDALGMPFSEFKPQYLSFSENAVALRNGSIDAALTLTAAPSPFIMDIESTHSIRLVPLTEAESKKITGKYSYFLPYTIAKGAYKSLEGDIPTFAAWKLVAAKREFPEEAAYQIVKTVFEHLDEIQKVHPTAKFIKPENIGRIKIPYHAGAIRYFKEKGYPVN